MANRAQTTPPRHSPYSSSTTTTKRAGTAPPKCHQYKKRARQESESGTSRPAKRQLLTHAEPHGSPSQPVSHLAGAQRDSVGASERKLQAPQLSVNPNWVPGAIFLVEGDEAPINQPAQQSSTHSHSDADQLSLAGVYPQPAQWPQLAMESFDPNLQHPYQYYHVPSKPYMGHMYDTFLPVNDNELYEAFGVQQPPAGELLLQQGLGGDQGEAIEECGSPDYTIAAILNEFATPERESGPDSNQTAQDQQPTQHQPAQQQPAQQQPQPQPQPQQQAQQAQTQIQQQQTHSCKSINASPSPPPADPQQTLKYYGRPGHVADYPATMYIARPQDLTPAQAARVNCRHEDHCLAWFRGYFGKHPYMVTAAALAGLTGRTRSAVSKAEEQYLLSRLGPAGLAEYRSEHPGTVRGQPAGVKSRIGTLDPPPGFVPPHTLFVGHTPAGWSDARAAACLHEFQQAVQDFGAGGNVVLGGTPAVAPAIIHS